MRLWCQLKNNNAQPCFYLVIQNAAVRRAWNPPHGTAKYPYPFMLTPKEFYKKGIDIMRFLV